MSTTHDNSCCACASQVKKEILRQSDTKPSIWKRFINDVISMWNTSRDRIDDFLLKANSFHPAIKFTPEISETETTFLDTKVCKVVRFNKVNKVSILDVQTHFKTTETFQYKNMSLSNFKTRLQNRGYPTRIVEKHLSEIKFSDREMSLAQKNKTARKKILSFVTQYHTTLSNLKDTLMGK